MAFTSPEKSPFVPVARRPPEIRSGQPGDPGRGNWKKVVHNKRSINGVRLFREGMPSTRSKAGGSGCGCGAAVAVLRAGVVDEVVKKVRKAWDVDALNDIDGDIRNMHNKTIARRLLDTLVDDLEVLEITESDISWQPSSQAVADERGHQ